MEKIKIEFKIEAQMKSLKEHKEMATKQGITLLEAMKKTGHYDEICERLKEKRLGDLFSKSDIHLLKNLLSDVIDDVNNDVNYKIIRFNCIREKCNQEMCIVLKKQYDNLKNYLENEFEKDIAEFGKDKYPNKYPILSTFEFNCPKCGKLLSVEYCGIFETMISGQ